jgi:hypothetical protein
MGAMSTRTAVAIGAGIFVALSTVVGVTGVRIDPGDQAFDVKILNDEHIPVTANQCYDDRCDDFASKTRLAPGESTSVITSDMGVANPYLISTVSGKQLGCLPLLFHRKVEGAVVRVSTRRRC